MDVAAFDLLIESIVNHYFPQGYARSTKSGTLYQITMVMGNKAEGFIVRPGAVDDGMRAFISLNLLTPTDRHGDPIEMPMYTPDPPDPLKPPPPPPPPPSELKRIRTQGPSQDFQSSFKGGKPHPKFARRKYKPGRPLDPGGFTPIEPGIDPETGQPPWNPGPDPYDIRSNEEVLYYGPDPDIDRRIQRKFLKYHDQIDRDEFERKDRLAAYGYNEEERAEEEWRRRLKKRQRQRRKRHKFPRNLKDLNYRIKRFLRNELGIKDPW